MNGQKRLILIKEAKKKQKWLNKIQVRDPETGSVVYVQKSKIGEIVNSSWNLGQSDEYWYDKDIYGVGRMLAFGTVGLGFIGYGIYKATSNKKTKKKLHKTKKGSKDGES